MCFQEFSLPYSKLLPAFLKMDIFQVLYVAATEPGKTGKISIFKKASDTLNQLGNIFENTYNSAKGQRIIFGLLRWSLSLQ